MACKRSFDISPKDADLPVVGFKQGVHRTVGGFNVIRGHAGQIVKVHPFGLGGYHDTGNIYPGKVLLEIFRVAPQEQQA